MLLKRNSCLVSMNRAPIGRCKSAEARTRRERATNIPRAKKAEAMGSRDAFAGDTRKQDGWAPASHSCHRSCHGISNAPGPSNVHASRWTFANGRVRLRPLEDVARVTRGAYVAAADRGSPAGPRASSFHGGGSQITEYERRSGSRPRRVHHIRIRRLQGRQARGCQNGQGISRRLWQLAVLATAHSARGTGGLAIRLGGARPH